MEGQKMVDISVAFRDQLGLSLNFDKAMFDGHLISLHELDVEINDQLGIKSIGEVLSDSEVLNFHGVDALIIQVINFDNDLEGIRYAQTIKLFIDMAPLIKLQFAAELVNEEGNGIGSEYFEYKSVVTDSETLYDLIDNIAVRTFIKSSFIEIQSSDFYQGSTQFTP